MDEIKQIIELLELNLSIMSQVPSVYKRTQEALRLAKTADAKLDDIDVSFLQLSQRVAAIEDQRRG